MADVDTPSGFNSALEPTDTDLTSSSESARPSQEDASSSNSMREVFGSDILSSTVRDGAVAPTEEEVEISVIENLEVHFCSKCGEIFQS